MYLTSTTIYVLEGLFAGGWVGPEWRGGVGPATLALMIMFFYFV